MGNLLSGPIKNILSKYTYNFEGQQLNLQLLRGHFSLENLIINEKEVNAVLEQSNIPVRLKFGLLKKFDIKLSIIGAKLEKLEVEDFIMILGPANQVDPKFEGEEELEMWSLVLKNHLAATKGQKAASLLNPDIFLEKERLKKQKELEDRLKKEKSQKAKDEKAKNAPPKGSEMAPNIMGIEVFQIIKNLLDCKISIQNIYIIYEDNLDFLYSQEDLSSFIVTMHLKQFNFQNDAVTKYTDKDGIFKNFMNISNYLKKSGTWTLSDMAYWNIGIESFSISFSVGNKLFISSMEGNNSITPQNAPAVLNEFKKTLRENSLQNSFDIIQVSRISVDMIIFYKETSKVPVHGVFVLCDCGNIVVNVEAYKMAVLMDVVAHFQTLALSRKFDLVKPKFRILTHSRFESIAAKLKLTTEQRSHLRKINRYVIHDYLNELFYIIRYEALISDGADPEMARILVLLEYCKLSKVYTLIFGDQVPDLLRTELERQKNAAKAKPKPTGAVLKEGTPNNMPHPTDAPAEKKSLKESQMVLILNKIHVHVRVQVNFSLNLLSQKTNTRENALIVESFVVDALKPVGQVKGKMILSFNRISMVYNKGLFVPVSKPKMSIFDNLQSSNANRNQSMIATESADNLLEMRSSSFAFEFTLEEARNLRQIYIVYSTIKVGQMVYNYVPVVFASFAQNILALTKFHGKSFNTKVITNFEKDLKKFGGKKQFNQKTTVVNKMKGNLFEKKMKAMEGHGVRPKVPNSSNNSFYKKSNVVIDFERSESRRADDVRNMKKTLHTVS